MRKLPIDIINEMKIRFDTDFNSAKKILEEYVIKHDYLDSDRIIRCVIYLADNGLESFETYLESAKGDPRDVMWWAEYKNHDSLENNERIKDFTKTFPENGV